MGEFKAKMEEFRAKMEEFSRKQEEYMERRARQHNEIMTVLRELAISRGCDVSDWPSSVGVEGVEAGTHSARGCETKVVVKTSVVNEQHSTEQTDQEINIVEDTGTKPAQSHHEERSKELKEVNTLVAQPAVVKDISENYGDVLGSHVLKQNKYNYVLQSSITFLWGWSLITTTAKEIFDQKHVAIDTWMTVVFKDRKQESVEKKFGYRREVGSEVNYDDDYPWDPGIPEAIFAATP